MTYKEYQRLKRNRNRNKKRKEKKREVLQQN